MNLPLRGQLAASVIANAFDGTASTYFDGPTADGCWLGLDLGTNHPAVTQIRYTCRAGYGGRMVGGQFQISSASDFSSGVVTLATIATAPSDGVSVAVPITGATEERYVRYLSPSGSYGDIAELEFDSSSCSNFAYDGLSRRVQIVEQNATGGVTITRNDVWIGQSMAEERDASNTVTKRFFPQGEQQYGTSNYYYTRDHLGSAREMISTTGTIIARYSYDDYRRKTYVQGSHSATFEYAGMFLHTASGLNLTQYRAYDPNTGRWLSRDPMQERVGNNLYDYVLNSPLASVDPFGLDKIDPAMIYNMTIPGAHSSTSVNTSVGCIDKACSKILFIQTVRGSDDPNWNIDYNTSSGKPDQPYPFYPYQTQTSTKSPGRTSMSDEPGIYNNDGGSPKNPGTVTFWIEFETCAICMDNKTLIGCVRWGFSMKNGKPDWHYGPPTISPPMPSQVVPSS